MDLHVDSGKRRHMGRHEYIDEHHGSHSRHAKMEEEMKGRHHEMNVHRKTEMIKRLEDAGLDPEQKQAVLLEIDEYFEIERQLVEKRFENRLQMDDLYKRGRNGAREREVIIEDFREARDAQRDTEKELRDRARFKRRDIEEKIQRQSNGGEL